MGEQEIHAMSRAIGALESSVKTLTDNWKQQDDAATVGRRVLHDKIDGLTLAVSQLATRAEVDALKTAVIKLAGRFDGLEARVSAIEPRAMEWNNHRQQVIGSKKVIAVVWGIMLAGTSVLGGVVVKLFDIFWPPKH